MTKFTWSLVLGIGLLFVGLVLHLFLGELQLSALQLWEVLIHRESDELAALVVWKVRAPRALAALGSGVVLGWLGLLMQVWFRNPLAGPGVLGITSGGSLGVALVVLFGIGIPTWVGASLGCLAVLVLIAFASRKFASPVTTLVFGLMISYAVGASVTVLESSATAEALQTFVFWGMGTFGKASLWQSFGALVILALVGVWMWCRSSWLESWMLGEDLAQTMGVRRQAFQLELLLVAGFALGWITSICGPLAFLGLATPHVYRFFHEPRGIRASLLGVALWGGVLALGADGVVRFMDISGWLHVPLNAVLAMLGAPVVVAVLWKQTHDWS